MLAIARYAALMPILAALASTIVGAISLVANTHVNHDISSSITSAIASMRARMWVPYAVTNATKNDVSCYHTPV